MKHRVGLLMSLALLAAGFANGGQVADLSRDGIGIVVDADPEVVDPGRDFFVTVTVTSPADKPAALPDLRERFQGFQVAEDFAEEPTKDAEGRTVVVTRWRLVPEPLARRYRLAPFVVTAGEGAFYTAPVRFTPPAAREAASGGIEIKPVRDLPPLSWRLVGMIAAVLAGAAALAAVVYLVVRKIRLMVKIHRMSPIERAFYELDQLLQRELPARGLYKDFYVELTRVVRRFIERQHGFKAPNLTTEEFFDAAQKSKSFPQSALDELIAFFRSADMVKFAGVTATGPMADSAVDSARVYIRKDDEITAARAKAQPAAAPSKS